MTKIHLKKIFLIFTLSLLINTQHASACMFIANSTAQEAFKSNDVVFSGVRQGCYVSGDKRYILYEVDKIWKGKKYNNFKYLVGACPSEIEVDFVREYEENSIGQKFIVYSKYENKEYPTNYLYSPSLRCDWSNRHVALTYENLFETLKSFFDGRRSEAKKELQFLDEPIYQNAGE